MFGPLMLTEFIPYCNYSKKIELCDRILIQCKKYNLKISNSNCLMKIIKSMFKFLNEDSQNEDNLQNFIIKCCINLVQKNIDEEENIFDDDENVNDEEQEISFYDFVVLSITCQWLPQNLRVEAWIRTILLKNINKEFLQSRDLIISKFYKNHQFNNEHSPHLIPFMIIDEEKELNPCFSYLEIDYSSNYQDLILQQCIQDCELNWDDLEHKWNTFPFSLEFLMNLIWIYHQPLKLLFLISKLNIFRILENVKKEKFPKVIEKLENFLNDKNKNCLELVNL